MCERCDGRLERVELLGGMILARCAVCGHKQFVRLQQARGTIHRADGTVERVIEGTGVIEAWP